MGCTKAEKSIGIKHKIRKEKEREQRLAVAVTVAILIVILAASGFLIYSTLNSPSQIRETGTADAVIVDQLSMTFPNETFKEYVTDILKQAGYKVDYYRGEEVTVEFFRNLPTHGYKLVILRAHSTAAGLDNTRAVVSLFTCEPYDRTKYFGEQLAEQIVRVAYSQADIDKDITYFGIRPVFITQCTNGKFKNTVIIAMGCEGSDSPSMALAFIARGAKAYLSWDRSVSASHTDRFTTHILQSLVAENQTIGQALQKAFDELGTDQTYKSQMTCYPCEAEGQTIEKPRLFEK